MLAVRDSAKGLIVHIAPITTQYFADADHVAIPEPVVRHLALDARSIIVTSEYNTFVWIGPDVFPRADGLVHYGKVPERLQEQVRNAAIAKRPKHCADRIGPNRFVRIAGRRSNRPELPFSAMNNAAIGPGRNR